MTLELQLEKGRTMIEIKQLKDGYRLKQTYNNRNVYIFLSFADAAELSSRIDMDSDKILEEAEKEWEQEKIKTNR